MEKQHTPPLITRAQKFGSILGLQSIRNLLQELGNPQEKLQIIHIAGTNGKGSIASFMKRMLMENNLNIGLFTSPYFETPREMIRYNQALIPRKSFEELLTKIEVSIDRMLKKNMAHPTEFEIYVALAFEYFAQMNIDYVILEVGLGGREDATNIIKSPVLSIISHIALDHTQFLGDTLEKIAYHKGGIIKDKVPVIVYPQEAEVRKVLETIATSKNSPYYSFEPEQVEIHSRSLLKQRFSVNLNYAADTAISKESSDISSNKNIYLPNVKIQLLGKHQILNATTALLAMMVLQEKKRDSLAIQSMLTGLYKTKWPGRFEILGLHPLTVVDGAHNIDAVKSLTETLKNHCSEYSITLILGMLEDKDVDGFLSEILPFVDRVLVTKPISPRALDPEKLKEKIQSYPVDVIVEPSITNASLKALETTNSSDMVLAVGSLYMVGEVRRVLMKHFNSSESFHKSEKQT